MGRVRTLYISGYSYFNIWVPTLNSLLCVERVCSLSCSTKNNSLLVYRPLRNLPFLIFDQFSDFSVNYIFVV